MFQLKVFMFLLHSILFLPYTYSQIQNIWIGGSPGREDDWHCHKNWSKFKVPNEFNKVIIPNTRTSTFVYPVIEKGNVTIYSLEMHPGTILYVKQKSPLFILDELSTFSEETHQKQKNGMIKIFGLGPAYYATEDSNKNYVSKIQPNNIKTKDLKN
ncbi:MAG: hypothetical protein IPO62_13555 [Saprospiraceae bacterium]|nr:hypothetical protein [Saprospiraceae bacterium]